MPTVDARVAPNSGPPATPSLAGRARSGALWFLLQSLSTRLLGVVQTLALAWLLGPGDWGAVGLAYTVTSFLAILADPGIEVSIVARQVRMRRWTTAAFWMSLTLGCAGAAAMWALAPAAAWLYGVPEVAPLISVLALSAPLNALMVAPNAVLKIGLRFREIAAINFAIRLTTVTLTVAAAAAGWGAYSFVAPVPIASGVGAIVAWSLARPRLSCGLSLHRWPSLISAGSKVGVTKLLQNAVTQGPFLVLGVSGFSESVVGLFFFATSLSTQAYQLLSGAIVGTLFPALARLHIEPARQFAAAERASRVLAVLSVPFCLVQIVIAPWFFPLFFPIDKQSAMVTYQLLTLGVVVNASSWPAGALMQAQSRFASLMNLWLVYGACYYVALIGGAQSGSVRTVAAAAAVSTLIGSVAGYVLGFHPRGIASFLKTHLRPVVAGVVSTAAATLVSYVCVDRLGAVFTLVAMIAVFSAVYLAAMAAIGPADLVDSLEQLRLGRLIRPLMRRRPEAQPSGK